MPYYLVTGRIAFDDEDSAEVFPANNPEQAADLMRAHLREVAEDLDPDEGDTLEIYINVIAHSSTPIDFDQTPNW